MGYAYGTTGEREVAPTESPSDASNAETVQQPPPKTPQVFEKDTQGLVPASWLSQEDPEYLESCTLKFPLEAFNRVEGEVIVKKIRDGVATPVEEAGVFALVLDPHGNVVIQNGPYSRHQKEFPWRFSFVASTTGEHGLTVNTGGVQWMDILYVAHLKVTVYEK